jgi:hypothetical protein
MKKLLLSLAIRSYFKKKIHHLIQISAISLQSFFNAFYKRIGVHCSTQKAINIAALISSCKEVIALPEIY